MENSIKVKHLWYILVGAWLLSPIVFALWIMNLYSSMDDGMNIHCEGPGYNVVVPSDGDYWCVNTQVPNDQDSFFVKKLSQ